VIVAGEYDRAMRHVRDLRASFLLDGPETFWAGEEASLLDARGYRLASLETDPASVGPFEYAGDFNEGRATFVGAKGEIVLEKKDRRWMIRAAAQDLARHGLDSPQGDERTFLDAVSGCLLSSGPAPPGGAAAPPPFTVQGS